MRFGRRDILLLGASLLVSAGLLPFIPLVYAILAGAAVFFGIKILAKPADPTG